MKKLLGIVVLGLLLSGCGGAENIRSEVEAWNRYKSSTGTYKVWGEIYNWKSRGFSYGKVAAWGNVSLDNSITYLMNISSCSEGCKITHIGLNEISEERQKEIVAEYLPPGFVDKFFPKPKKIAKVNKKSKKKEAKKITTPSPEPEDPKKENQKEEEGFKKMLKNYFGDRKLHSIEGLWGYRKDEEKEARIYLIFKSDDDDYLFKEMVVYHPIREFEKKISTKVIKKISEKSYEVKRTWNNKGTISERDGIVTIINKFKLKFESDRHCYSNEEECLKENTVYKKKIWPPKVYTDKVDLNEEQTDKLKGLLE